MVIEVSFILQHRAATAQNRCGHLFGRGLPVASGHPDQGKAEPVSMPDRHCLQRRQRIVDQDKKMMPIKKGPLFLPELKRRAGNDGPRRAALKDRVDEIMAVEPRAVQCKENFIRPDCPAVDRKSSDDSRFGIMEIPFDGSPASFRNFVYRPHWIASL